jgi:hypothetical protein
VGSKTEFFSSLLEGTTIYPLIIYAKASKSDISDQEIMRALRAIGKIPEER